MKHKYSLITVTLYSLFLFSHHSYTSELALKNKPSEKISFDHIAPDVQKHILKKLINLYAISATDITPSVENLAIWLINIHQYCKPVKLCRTEIPITDLVLLTKTERKTVQKIANPSLMRTFYGYTPDIISEHDYKDLDAMSIGKKLKSTDVQYNEVTYQRTCATATCTCGMLLCCCTYTPLGTVYTNLGAIVCLATGCFCASPEMCVRCNRMCCDKYVNPGFKPQHKKFS
jgi:hypothetical protein